MLGVCPVKIEPYQVKVYMQARKTGATQAQASALARDIRTQWATDRRGSPFRGAGTPPRLAHPLRPLKRGLGKRVRTDAAEGASSCNPRPCMNTFRSSIRVSILRCCAPLQRRVSEWKRHHGESPEVMFELRHEPGLMGFSDFTELKGVTITINGEPYPHLIYHYRLAYSGWQYAQIIEGGESFVALSEGLQNAFEACGGVPRQQSFAPLARNAPIA